MTQRHLPSLSLAAATDQSKLPKDNGGQRAGLIKRRQWALPDGRGDDSDGVVIAEINAHWRRQDQEDD